LALLDVKKASDMFNKLKTPIIGVIENMSNLILEGEIRDSNNNIFSKIAVAFCPSDFGQSILKDILKLKNVYYDFISENEINKYDQKVGISYADNTLDNVNFRWINSFESIDSRKSFVELWQSSVIGKEIQAQLLEQSKCRGSEIYAAYKVL